MKCAIAVAVLFGVLLPATYSRHVQFYRKDYTYIEKFDAFYKVHWDINGLSWNNAFLTCDDEGATLFYPKAMGEWNLVKNLTNKMTEIPNVTDIFVGFHDEFNLGEFITVDGHSTPFPLLADGSSIVQPNNCVTMNIDTGLFNIDTCVRTPDTPLPFVCKKVEDESCPTIDSGYKYMKTSRKCYKVNVKPQMWQDAMKTCYMEGGVLAVVEDSVQAKDIYNMIQSDQEFFVGVRRLFTRSDYYTIKGQKFSDMYQNQHNDGNADCGTVIVPNQNLYTSTSDCGTRLPFICEMEIAKQT